MTRSDQRTARVLLQITTDKRAFADANRQLAQFDKTLSDLARQKGFGQLAQDASRAVSEGKNLRVVMAGLRSDLLKVGASDREIDGVVRQFVRLREEAERAAAAAAGARRGAALQQLGREARLAAPAIPIPGTGLSSEAIFRAAEIAGKLNLNLKDLAISGGLTAVAMVGVVIAFKQFQTTINAVASELKAIADARVKAAEFGAQKTSKDIGEQIDEIKNTIKDKTAGLVQAEADLATQQANLFRRGIHPIEQFVGALGELGIGPIGDAKKRVDEAKASIAGLTTELDALEQQLDSDTVAANDLAAALEYARQQQEEAAIRLQGITDRQLRTQISAQLTIAELDAKGTRSRIGSLEREQEAIQSVLQSGRASTELFAELTDRLRDISGELIVFKGALPQKEAIERAKELFERIKTGIQEAIERAKEIRQIGQAIVELRTNFQQRLGEIQQRLTEQLLEAERTRNNAISEARRAASIAEAEAARQAGIDRAEAERQSQINIQRIIRRFNRDRENAVQDRDAVALAAARARRDDELRTERENLAERQRAIDMALREQLRTIRMRLGEQLRTIDIRYQEQVRRAQLAAQKSIQIETAKYQVELAKKVEALRRLLGIEDQATRAQLQVAVSGAGQELRIKRNFWQKSLDLAAQALQQLAAGGQQFGTGVPPTMPTGGNVGFAPVFATGGKVTKTGLAVVDKGELILNPKRGQMPGGITINANGMSPRQVGRTVERKLTEFVQGQRDG